MNCMLRFHDEQTNIHYDKLQVDLNTASNIVLGGLVILQNVFFASINSSFYT